MKWTFGLFFFLSFGRIHQAQGLMYVDMNDFTRMRIGEIYISSVREAMPYLIDSAAEDIVYESWNHPLCTKNTFYMRRIKGYYPVTVLWNWVSLTRGDALWIDEGVRCGEDATPSMQSQEDGKRGLFVPTVLLGSGIFFTFLKENPSNNLSQCKNYTYITNLTFRIEGRLSEVKKDDARHQQKNAFVVKLRKNLIDSLMDDELPIILSRREATEIVYLTALCRGRVRTMDEFNAAFVPKGETFLVRLTVPECETEIGRMLYDLARKRGLLGRKGDWK